MPNRQATAPEPLTMQTSNPFNSRVTDPAATRQPAPRGSAWWLLLIAVLPVAALLWHGPVPQWADYHAFADTRAWLGIPHAANVLSNLPFAAVGAWGLWALRDLGRAGLPAESAADLAWRVFCVALIATAAGSSLYHWAPDNTGLALDRLPIAWACAALLCGFLGERVDARWASWPALAAALLLASASVAHWWWTESLGHGDLRAYLAVQFLPMLLVPAALLMRLPPAGDRAVGGAAWWGVLGLYGLAKLAELADHRLLEASGLLASGHTLKHLLAAAAAALLVAALRSGLRTGSRR